MLGKWEKSDNRSVQSHRKLVDAINALGVISPTGDIFTQTNAFGLGILDKRLPWNDEYRDAVIVPQGPNGEADYNDERYWCQLAQTDPLHTDQTDLLRATPSPSITGDSSAYILSVTNRLESFPDRTRGLHTLRPGMWVRVRPVIDGDAQLRWAMEEPPQTLFGIIVCNGPCGESDYSDARYWVAFARCGNTAADGPTAELSLFIDSSFPDGCSSEDGGSSGSSPRIITATNLNEADCDLHEVRPDTPVVLKWALDGSNPAKVRWTFEVADLSTCNEACPPPGGSSSSACPCIQVTYYAGEGGEASIQLSASGPNGFYTGPGGSGLSPSNGNWELTLPDGTMYKAPGGGPCPPTDLNRWQLQESSGTPNSPLLGIEPCPSSESSSSGSEGSSGDCVEVIKAGTLTFTLNPETCEVTPSYETVFVHACGTEPGRTFVNGVPTS